MENDNPVLPKVWKDELENYFSYLDGKDVDTFYNTFDTVGLRLVELMNSLKSVNIDKMIELEEEEQESQNDNPSFVEVLLDAINSEYVSKEMVLWFMFLAAAVAGLGLAFLKGQGWGVLLVTIVFGGLRLYDRQTD